MAWEWLRDEFGNYVDRVWVPDAPPPAPAAQQSAPAPMTPEQKARAIWGEGAIYDAASKSVFLPGQNISVPVNDDFTQDLVRSTENANSFSSQLGNLLPAAFIGAATGNVLSGLAGPSVAAASGDALGAAAAAGDASIFGGAGAAYELPALSAAAGGTAATQFNAVPPVDAGVGGSPNAPGSFAVDSVTGDVVSTGTIPGAVGTVGGGGALAATGAGLAAGTSPLSNVTGIDPSLAQLLGIGGATALGLYGSNQQSNAFSDLANKYFDVGAPSRARYEASFAPGFKASDTPGFQDALDTSWQSALRGLSTQGNPFGNPGGLTEANKYITGNLALPYLNEYRRLNAGSGGLAALTAAAPSAATGAIGAQGNTYNVLGAGIADLTRPSRPSLYDLYRQQGLA